MLSGICSTRTLKIRFNERCRRELVDYDILSIAGEKRTEVGTMVSTWTSPWSLFNSFSFSSLTLSLSFFSLSLSLFLLILFFSYTLARHHHVQYIAAWRFVGPIGVSGELASRSSALWNNASSSSSSPHGTRSSFRVCPPRPFSRSLPINNATFHIHSLPFFNDTTCQ